MPRRKAAQEELVLSDVHIQPAGHNTYKIRFITSAGSNKALLHHRNGNRACTFLLSGAGGGLDGPASIYKDMGPDLLDKNISSLRLDYREHNNLADCVLDTLIGIEFMKGQGMEKSGIVGWSFGGAVAILAGIESDVVRAVATVASQSYGTGTVGNLSPKALLLLHGTGDHTLPPACSQDIYRRAKDPKEIVLYEGANHGIDQRRGEMLHKIEEFMVRYLGEEE